MARKGLSVSPQIQPAHSKAHAGTGVSRSGRHLLTSEIPACESGGIGATETLKFGGTDGRGEGGELDPKLRAQNSCEHRRTEGTVYLRAFGVCSRKVWGDKHEKGNQDRRAPPLEGEVLGRALAARGAPGRQGAAGGGRNPARPARQCPARGEPPLAVWGERHARLLRVPNPGRPPRTAGPAPRSRVCTGAGVGEGWGGGRGRRESRGRPGSEGERGAPRGPGRPRALGTVVPFAPPRSPAASAAAPASGSGARGGEAAGVQPGWRAWGVVLARAVGARAGALDCGPGPRICKCKGPGGGRAAPRARPIGSAPA